MTIDVLPRAGASALSLAALLVSCAASTQLERPSPLPLAADLATPVRRADPSAAVSVEESSDEEPRDISTLRAALALALLRSPSLTSSAWELRASEARALQAGLLPNPSLDGDLENFGGTDALSGFEGAETTLVLSQLIELGGKRSSRVRAARLESLIADHDFESKRLAVVVETTQAFVELLAAQEKLGYSERALELAEEALRAARIAVETGAATPDRSTLAEMRVARRSIERDRAAKRLTVARARLGATWGGTGEEIERVEGDLADTPEVPPLESLLPLLSEHPDLARWSTAEDALTARLELEEARAIPDVEVRGGVRWLEEGDDTAFVVGLRVPLPLFDRNQGGIDEARAALSRSESQQLAARTSLRLRLERAHAECIAARNEAIVFSDRVIPGARQLLESARTSYEAGQLSYLELVVVERGLYEALDERVDALAAYHTARAELEALTGRPLASVESAPLPTEDR